MCRLAGIVSNNADMDIDIEHVATIMRQVLEHRGPDGEGWHMENNIVLGMRRLSIIYIAHAQQPFKTSDRQIIVLFNEEIYNLYRIEGKTYWQWLQIQK